MIWDGGGTGGSTTGGETMARNTGATKGLLLIKVDGKAEERLFEIEPITLTQSQLDSLLAGSTTIQLRASTDPATGVVYFEKA